LKVTPVAPVRFVPRMLIVLPTAAAAGNVFTNGPKPKDILKMVP